MIFYTDGGAVPNPGFGGFGVYCEEINLKKFMSFGNVTNNQMELAGVIFAYNYIKSNNIKKNVKIITDSQYVVNGINTWKKNWKIKNWKDVKNKELWLILDKLETEMTNISVEWIKGHDGHSGNEIADSLATLGVEEKSTNSIEKFINQNII